MIAWLKDGWSPDQIAGRLMLEQQVQRVGSETIYTCIYGRDGQSTELARLLLGRLKKRRPRYARRPRGLVFPQECSIHQRPDPVKTRETFGD
uniref:hypothetical protein n=1 Tax=Paenirhodobacter populi TaxID=2306993 RepID=UPI001F4E8F1A|nr:hypothetical protein [Sinirhodobacter populi]